MQLKDVFIFLFSLIIFGFALACYHGFYENILSDEYFASNKIKIDFEGKTETEINTVPQTTDFHYSFFGKKEFYDKAFESINNSDSSERKKDNSIKGIIVNHHLLAPNLIAKAINSASTEKEITIVLLSPNHFSAGRGQITSSLYDWQTPYGVLEADKNLIKELQDALLVNIDEKPFEEEHGISNLVAFIKKSFPNAKVVPLIIKDTFSLSSADAFAKNLDNLLPENSLVIASLDFSHYLPDAAADFHDEKSMAVLDNFDYNGVKFLDIDSKPVLRIFLKYIDSRNARKFNLLGHSNSAKILGGKKILEATSYITGVFSTGEKEENKKITLLAFGDLMLDRYIRQTIKKNGNDYPFEKIKRLLDGNDFTLTNLEGSFTNFQPKALDPNNIIFTFDPDLVPELKRFGFNIFNLANNHSLNFGQSGLSQSKEYLKENELDYFGDPQNNIDISIIKKVRETKVGFIGYNELSGINKEGIITEIEKIKNETDFVVVYTHWGGEYQTKFSSGQQKTAHQFIDAGADVIIGSHPHVIQPTEIYKNKLIFYSLGNFLFDQTFSTKTQQGLGLGIVFNKTDIKYYIFPIETKNFQVNLMEKEKSDILLLELANNSLASEDIKKQISEGVIKIED